MKLILSTDESRMLRQLLTRVRDDLKDRLSRENSVQIQQDLLLCDDVLAKIVREKARFDPDYTENGIQFLCAFCGKPIAAFYAEIDDKDGWTTALYVCNQFCAEAAGYKQCGCGDYCITDAIACDGCTGETARRCVTADSQNEPE